MFVELAPESKLQQYVHNIERMIIIRKIIFSDRCLVECMLVELKNEKRMGTGQLARKRAGHLK